MKNREIPVDVTLVPGGGFDVRIDDRRVDADMVEVSGGYSVRVGDRVLDVAIEGKPPELGIVAGGYRGFVVVESERQKAVSAARRGRLDSQQNVVISPMPGRIVKVFVEAGQEIAVGEPVIVVEAMKMENELRAPRSGQVKRVLVSVGERVEGNATLIELT
ncbi:MAG TPA: hypothetical protein PKW66_26030 [Polyangiaceae bacterium]|nr:hypothetical protein [Polyangiaceae bacterium]